MPDKFVSKIVTPFGERLIKAVAVTDDLKKEINNIVVFKSSYSEGAWQWPSYSEISAAYLKGKTCCIVQTNPAGAVDVYWLKGKTTGQNLRFHFEGNKGKYVDIKIDDSVSDGVVYDDQLNATSTNAVQNKTIFAAINGAKSIEFIDLNTTFAQVGTILTDGKLPVLVEETTPGSPNYYSLIKNNAGTEYIFGNVSGTLNRTYKLSGGGWTLDASISFENSSNKVTSWSSTPSDTQYPSEKLVYDTIGDVESLLAAL